MTRAYPRGRKYPLWFCATCGHGVSSLHWRLHRRMCLRIPDGTECERCGDSVPCRKKGRFVCPNYESRVEVSEEEAPDISVVRSLKMRVSRLSDGRWKVQAPWLRDSVIADTWLDAYWTAVKERTER